MLRLIRLERRIARLEARAARRAAARRDRRVFGEADAEDPREVIIRRLNELARRLEPDPADAADWYRGWAWQGDRADRHRACIPGPETPPPEPVWPNDTEAAGEAPRPPAGPPVRPPARSCEAPGALPCRVVCRLGGHVDCRALARRGFTFAAPPEAAAPVGLSAAASGSGPLAGAAPP